MTSRCLVLVVFTEERGQPRKTCLVRRVALPHAHAPFTNPLRMAASPSSADQPFLDVMNMAICGIDFNFGKQPADTFLSDQHPDLRADTAPRGRAISNDKSHFAGPARSKGQLMANPPFNISEWWDGRLEGDPRWAYGTPPKSNANFAWVQHMLYHLAPTGSMALLLANGSMSSNTKGEGEIRRALVEANLVECMLALPGQLFTNNETDNACPLAA